MLNSIIKRAVQHETAKRWSLLTTAFFVTLAPARFAREVIAAKSHPLKAGARFMLLAVGTVLLIEAAFSYVFQTEFSDLIHHAFPVLVAVTGGFAIYVLLKVLWTPNVTFANTLAGSFFVGGTALFVMIGLIFSLLIFDFSSNYQSVMTSGCTPRTIMCLLSGNTQSEYGLMQDVATRETQGQSFPFIVLTILACIVIYTFVLSSVLKAMMGVARWRSILAAVIAVLVLSPAYIILLNGIYRWLYGLS